ncbi:MAG TPA: hypothetical protein PK781_02335 [Terrimesophilobacter sp.]|nr:hypothetical protein [Terrimesophilobacter sp.]
MTDHTTQLVPYLDPHWVQVLPSRWVAEYDGEAAGSIDLTRRGRYRATDRHNRRIGTFRSIDEARIKLADSNRISRREHWDTSLPLGTLGLILLVATTGLGIYALTLLL